MSAPQDAARIASLREAARRHMQAREWPQAQAALEGLEAIHPGHPEVLSQLSYVASLQGHYRQARELALRSAQSAPSDQDVAGDILARLRTFNAGPELLAYLRRMGGPSRLPIPLLLQASAQLSYLNLHDDALVHLDEACRADPDFPPARVARAQVLMYLGRFAQAREDLLRCRSHAARIPQWHWLMAQVAPATPQDNRVDAIRAVLARLPADAHAAIATLATALHLELDALGDHDAAWDALMRACRAKRATLTYHVAEGRALVDGLIGMPLPDTDGQVDPADPVPIFIVGMHRSGTTLLEQMLDGHQDVHGVGELYDFTGAMRWVTDHHCTQVIDPQIVARAPAADLAEAGRRYLQGMRWRLGKQRWFTDKLPSNYLNLGFICRALPQARILHMTRDPVETCFSNLREQFSTANPFSYDQLELADFYLQYRRLMAHWHARHPGRILDVDYGRLTREPEAVLREVCAFCALPFQPEMLNIQNRTRGVATASAVQVRQGIVHRPSAKWRPYAAHLGPLIEALQAGGVPIPD